MIVSCAFCEGISLMAAIWLLNTGGEDSVVGKLADSAPHIRPYEMASNGSLMLLAYVFDHNSIINTPNMGLDYVFFCFFSVFRA